MPLPLRVLIVEDSEEDAQLLLHALRKGGYDPVSERVDTAAGMRSALARQSWDIVISDHALPQFNANEALALLKKSGFDLPFIIVSSSVGEDIAVAAMKLGAHDYLMKGQLARLVPAVERELREAEVRRQRRQAEEKARHQALYDLLTDLPNRVMFNDRLTLALAQAQRQHEMLAVLSVDLDRFKTIIDTLGPAMGDRVLRGVAERLVSCLEPGDTLARLGGDEFMVLLPQIQRADKAVKLAQQILEVLKPPFNYDAHELHVTTSMGISLYPYDGADADTILKNADTALNRAKEQGRNNYQLYTPAMNARAFERLALENALRKALERQQFLLHYQPQLEADTHRIIGIEALVRWQHPDLGLVYPSEFIPLAEETGLIVPLGEWVLRTACAQNKAWQAAGLPPLVVAVNLSARQFQHHDLVDTIGRVLKETELDSRYLELEITESIAMQNADFTIVILRDLKEMGVRIAMDDFGTGYSSLSYLRKFPIDSLKIDQSFVRDLSSDASDAAIANAVIVLAHSLKLQVVAEGVESKEQEEFLQSHQCDRLQGYLYSIPIPAVDLEKLLLQQRPAEGESPSADLASGGAPPSETRPSGDRQGQPVEQTPAEK
jgi:diguanylate cyclase (GGDEF)-like protein